MKKYVLLIALDRDELTVATEPTTDHAALCRAGDRLCAQGIGYVICTTDDVKTFIR